MKHIQCFHSILKKVEKTYTVCPLSHSVVTVLRDPLSYATFLSRSLEGSHMTVSTVFLISMSLGIERFPKPNKRKVMHYKAKIISYWL